MKWPLESGISQKPIAHFDSLRCRIDERNLYLEIVNWGNVRVTPKREIDSVAQTGIRLKRLYIDV